MNQGWEPPDLVRGGGYLLHLVGANSHFAGLASVSESLEYLLHFSKYVSG